MFSFSLRRDPLGAQRETAALLLHHARKVWAYRHDVLTPEASRRFQAARNTLSLLASEPSPPAGDDEALKKQAARFDVAGERMHEALHEAGGTVFPPRAIPEWVELLIVAAIIACSVRSFFLQPFKIPTNSMFPTYGGMTAKVYPLDDDGPGALMRAWRKLTLLAERVEVRSETGGDVTIPLAQFESPLQRPQDRLDNGIFGTRLLRSQLDVYTLFVGNTPVEIPVPKEFNFRSVVLHTYFPQIAAREELHEDTRWHLALRQSNALATGVLRTGVTVPKGGRVANFDVVTGDLVLVDRVSYNFTKPKVGDPFVFATRNIPRLNQDLYYIKRLAGRPGDTLQVREPVLLRNGDPADEKPAFLKNNARRTDLGYYGYLTGKRLSDECPLAAPHTLPPHHYFAMGDNSAGSYDSRGWGEVPEKEIVGRAFLILHPFTRRWGLAE
ncbi:MAG: signal peptidase I [Puniceicoccales bacterium]|jgi:signal peptidase I|nr:signal peptidase I [Puniceicoccales bacterium]